MTAYEVYKFLHIVASMVWIGSGAFELFASQRLLSGSRDVAMAYAEVGSDAGQKLYPVAAISTLVFGVLMVATTESLSFSDAWIGIGFAGVAISIVTGAVLIGQTTGKLIAALQQHGIDAAETMSLRSRLRVIWLVDFTVLLIVVWAMVAKPGA